MEKTEFENEFFLRGKPELLTKIKRKSQKSEETGNSNKSRKKSKEAVGMESVLSRLSKTESRLTKVENDHQELRDEFDKMMSHVIHMVQSGKPEEYQENHFYQFNQRAEKRMAAVSQDGPPRKTYRSEKSDGRYNQILAELR